MSTLNRLLLLALLVFSANLIASERYLHAAVDDYGALHIRTDDGRSLIVDPEPDLDWVGSPVGLGRIQISADRRAVGWLVLYRNCCTSYPIPLTLVVYADGVKRSYRGSGIPIWRWRFLAGGRQVGFLQETAHGGSGARAELRDVASGALIDFFDRPVGPDNEFVPDAPFPEWLQLVSTGDNDSPVPDNFIGRWVSTNTPCEAYSTEGTLEINARRVGFHASGGEVLSVQVTGDREITVLLQLYGEDNEIREQRLSLHLSPDGTRLRREDIGEDYSRCSSH